MGSEEKDREWFRRRFPTARARAAADKVVDELPVGAPMSAYLDAWILRYRAAGGKEPVFED